MLKVESKFSTLMTHNIFILYIYINNSYTNGSNIFRVHVIFSENQDSKISMILKINCDAKIR